jgi:hypothetical protein
MSSKSSKRKQTRRKKGGNKPSSAPKPTTRKKKIDEAETPPTVKNSSHAGVKKPDTSLGPTPEFSSAREFAQAIARERNLVEVGSALLGSQETKGASVRARMFETTLEYLYGKPAAAAPPEELPARVVWDIPMNPPDEPAE